MVRNILRGLTGPDGERANLNTAKKAPGLPYLALPVGSIRLLKFEPAPASRGHWSIEVYQRDYLESNGPKYFALSYVWGDTSNLGRHRIKIWINGSEHDVAVTKNLCEALRQFERTHSKTVSTEPKYIWVDALCINQGDTSEKNHQVASMIEIYKNASETICWLGVARRN